MWKEFNLLWLWIVFCDDKIVNNHNHVMSFHMTASLYRFFNELFEANSAPIKVTPIDWSEISISCWERLKIVALCHTFITQPLRVCRHSWQRDYLSYFLCKLYSASPRWQWPWRKYKVDFFFFPKSVVLLWPLTRGVMIVIVFWGFFFLPVSVPLL